MHKIALITHSKRFFSRQRSPRWHSTRHRCLHWRSSNRARCIRWRIRWRIRRSKCIGFSRRSRIQCLNLCMSFVIEFPILSTARLYFVPAPTFSVVLFLIHPCKISGRLSSSTPAFRDVRILSNLIYDDAMRLRRSSIDDDHTDFVLGDRTGRPIQQSLHVVKTHGTSPMRLYSVDVFGYVVLFTSTFLWCTLHPEGDPSLSPPCLLQLDVRLFHQGL